VSQLLPVGYRLDDAPYEWFAAVRFALMVLSFDELPTEDRPPRRLWTDAAAMEKWWAAVKERRAAEARGESKHIEDPIDNGYRLVTE
jgi:hypothetical protein